MAIEKEVKRAMVLGYNTATTPWRLTKQLGKTAFDLVSKWAETPEGEPTITDRLQAELPANEAKIGAELIHIAQKLSPIDEPDVRQQKSILQAGHTKITEAILEVETSPTAPEHIRRKVAEIAIQNDTDPTRLPDDVVPELSARRSAGFIDWYRRR